MQYRMVKIELGNGADPAICQCVAPIGFSFIVYGADYNATLTTNPNEAYKKDAEYNDARLICGCEVEVRGQ